MLISKDIPNLFNGVSQQPAQLRHPTQCELMDNAYPAIATGTRKRPPTKHRAKLRNATSADAFVHFIDKDATNRFVLIITSGSIEVFDMLTGAAHTVTSPSGTAYLTSSNPREDFGALTVADYTFIFNRKKTVAMDAAVVAGSVTGTKQQFSDLPAASGATGAIYRVEGTPTSNFDDYYVKSDGSVWVETAKPGVTYKLDATTMPWKLTKTGATAWTFDKNTWDDRLVGDDESNPVPSFVGTMVSDMFFHRNRLGILADESVVMSRAGKPFGFFAETVTAVLDSDPIDTAVSHTRVSLLSYAVPFNKALMLFSDRTQFQLSSPDTLTPKTPRADPVTEFESARLCKPASSGNALFFAVARDNSTALREYFVDKDTVSNDAADITAHCPTYIPKDVFRIASCNSEDSLAVLSLSERNKVWVYKFYWGKDEKVQSAWGRYVFDAGDTILGVEFIGNVGHFVILRADGVYLEYMEMESNKTDGTLGFLVHLDRRVELTGVYDAGNNWTTWTLPYADSGSFSVVLGDSFSSSSRGSSVAVTRPSSTTLRATGNYSAGPCYVGRNYTMRYRFSTIYLRDDKNAAITNGKLKLRRMVLNYDKSGYFRAEVTPRERDTYTYEFTGKYVGRVVLGEVSIMSGSFRFPVGCENIDAVIDIVSDSYLPVALQSATWEAEFTLKTARQ